MKHDNSPRLWLCKLELAPKLVIQGQQGRVWHITHGHLMAEILEPLQQSWVGHDAVQPAHLLTDREGVLGSSV